MRHFRLVGLALGVLALVEPLAAQAPTSSAAAAAELPSIQLPPHLERVLRDYERAWRAGDAVALASLFADDAFILQLGRPPMRGRSSIQAAYSTQAGGPLRLRALAHASADTVGYIIGAYGYGDAPGDVGKFTLTLRRPKGGRWMIFSDMDNPSQPMRRPPPAGAAPPTEHASP